MTKCKYYQRHSHGKRSVCLRAVFLWSTDYCDKHYLDGLRRDKALAAAQASGEEEQRKQAGIED